LGLIGQMICAKLGDRILVRMTKRNGCDMKPEYRLSLCCVDGAFTPIGLFWYGWSVQSKVHWVMPIIWNGRARVGQFSHLRKPILHFLSLTLNSSQLGFDNEL